MKFLNKIGDLNGSLTYDVGDQAVSRTSKDIDEQQLSVNAESHGTTKEENLAGLYRVQQRVLMMKDSAERRLAEIKREADAIALALDGWTPPPPPPIDGEEESPKPKSTKKK